MLRRRPEADDPDAAGLAAEAGDGRGPHLALEFVVCERTGLSPQVYSLTREICSGNGIQGDQALLRACDELGEDAAEGGVEVCQLLRVELVLSLDNVIKTFSSSADKYAIACVCVLQYEAHANPGGITQ